MEREPPQNIEAERELLGTCLLKQTELDAVTDVETTDLFLPEHRAAIDAMRSIHAAGGVVEPITVHAKMEQTLNQKFDLAYLIDLLGKSTVAGPRPAARLVIEASRARRAIALCGEITAKLYAQDPVDDVLTDGAKAFTAIELSGGTDADTDLGDEMSTALETIEKRNSDPGKAGLTTGINRFDHKIGVLSPGQLIVVAGSPGMGKSSYAQTVIEHLAKQGVPSLTFNYEMPKQEQTERFLSAKSRIPAHQIKNASLEYGDWKKLVDAGQAIASWPVSMITRDLTISRLIGEARRWYAKKAEGKHALIVVDYLQRVQPESKKGQSREREVADIATGLKRLAMTEGMKITVMALAQLNRSVAKEGRPPIMQDLRESGQIEQDADLIVFPWRETKEVEGGHELPNESGTCHFIVAKNRGGRIGWIKAYWDAPVMRFMNLVEDDDHWTNN